MEASPERRSSRLAEKRKQPAESSSASEKEEAQLESQTKGKRARKVQTSSKRRSKKNEGDQEPGGLAKKPRKTPRGKKTPSQDATGSASTQEEKREGTGKEKENEEEEEEGKHETEEEREEERKDTAGASTHEEEKGDDEVSLEEIIGEREMKASGVRFLEKGHIYFFYRPKVGEHEVQNIEEVQRLYILLSTKRSPELPNHERTHRLIAIPKKELPSIERRERHYCFVTKVTHHVKDIHGFLQEEHYSTKTLGER